MKLDKKVIESFLWSFFFTLVLLSIYLFFSDSWNTQVYSDSFLTVDFYSFFWSILLTIGISIFIYKNDKEDSKEQTQQLNLIKDGTRNYIKDFPEIFAKSLKMIHQINKENNYENFIYVNFFFNFGAVHAIFDENKKTYKKIALNLGLDKIGVDTGVDLTNLDQAVIFFNETLWEILENDNKSMFLLVGDSNLNLTKSVKYYNTTYEISKIIIKIIIAKNDNRKVKDSHLTFYQNAYRSKSSINTEEEQIDILSKIDKKHLFHDRNLPFIIRVVAYELNKQELTIEHLSNICKLFDIHSITKQDTKRLKILIIKNSNNMEDKKEIVKLKSEKFCILEAIYFLLKDVTKNTDTKEEQIKKLSLYIQYSKKINELLEKEFYQRKKLRNKIKNKTIDTANSKNEIYFLKKEHFPHQGMVGTFTKDDDRRKASLIFFISGDTTGSKPKGYYSELDDMYNLHFGAFKDIVASNFQRKE